MELCNCCARDIFEFEEDPLLEEEIQAITYGSLVVRTTNGTFQYVKLIYLHVTGIRIYAQM